MAFPQGVRVSQSHRGGPRLLPNNSATCTSDIPPPMLSSLLSLDMKVGIPM